MGKEFDVAVAKRDVKLLVRRRRPEGRLALKMATRTVRQFVVVAVRL